MVQEYTLAVIPRWVLKCADQALNLIRTDRGGVGLPIARAKSQNLPAMDLHKMGVVQRLPDTLSLSESSSKSIGV
jgi:hypothetical protein